MTYKPNITSPYTANAGITSTLPFAKFFAPRNPTSADVNYVVGQEWVNSTTDELWILDSFSTSIGVISANWSKMGSGILTVESFTVDSGAVVFPSAGNIVVTGFPVGASNLKGIKTFNGGGSGNIIEYQSLRDLSRYVVGVDANESQFTSIQAAINAAVADGHNSANPTLVYIIPGTYTEDLTLHSGIDLACVGTPNLLAVTIIKGMAVYNPGAGLNKFSAFGLTFSTNGAASPALSIQGSNALTASFLNCQFQGLSGTAYENIATLSDVRHQGCFYIASAGNKVFNLSGNSDSFLGCASQFFDTPSIIDTEKCGFFSCNLTDSFHVQNNGNPIFLACVLTGHAPGGANLEVLNIDATGQVGLLNCFIDTAAPSGFSVTGTGSLGYNVATTGQPFNPTVISQGFTTFTGNLSFNGGQTTISANGQLIIGDGTDGVPKIANLTSLDGSITITNGPGTIDLKTSGVGPSAPCFIAYLDTPTGAITGDGTTVNNIPFNATLVDNTSSFNTTTGVFTAPITGKYLLTVALNLQGINGAHVQGGSAIENGGVGAYSVSGWFGNPANMMASGEIIVNYSCIVFMTAGNTAQVNLQVTGGAKTVIAFGAALSPAADPCFFTGALLPV